LKDPARALRGIAQRQQENIDELEAEITSSVEANRNLIYAVIGFAILVGMIAGLSWLRADSRGNTQRA
jgi:CHASE3 domain sensor protein